MNNLIDIVKGLLKDRQYTNEEFINVLNIAIEQVESQEPVATTTDGGDVPPVIPPVIPPAE